MPFFGGSPPQGRIYTFSNFRSGVTYENRIDVARNGSLHGPCGESIQQATQPVTGIGRNGAAHAPRAGARLQSLRGKRSSTWARVGRLAPRGAGIVMVAARRIAREGQRI